MAKEDHQDLVGTVPSPRKKAQVGNALATPKQKIEVKKPRIPMFMSDSSIIDLNDFKDENVKIEHIAHALSNLCRYNGSCSRFYSVAEHSVRLARFAYNINMKSEYHKMLAKALLLHDAAEAYIGDVIFHLKKEMPQFIEFEKGIEKVINDKFGVTQILPLVDKELKELDRRISFDEMYALFGKIDPWFYDNRIEPLGAAIMLSTEDRIGWTPEYAKQQFLIVAQHFGVYQPPVEPETPATEDKANG